MTIQSVTDLSKLTTAQLNTLISNANTARGAVQAKERAAQLAGLATNPDLVSINKKIDAYVAKYQKSKKFTVTIPMTLTITFDVDGSQNVNSMKQGYSPSYDITTTAKVTVAGKISKEAREMVKRNIVDLAENSCSRILTLAPAASKFAKTIEDEGEAIRSEVHSLRNRFNLPKLP